jgi:hypothetical protein
MADYRKYCTECFHPIPQDWNKNYCPSCGGRVKLRIVRKSRSSQARPKPVEQKEKKEPKIRSTRKLTSRDAISIFASRENSALGPRFLYIPPALLFAQNVMTLGIRSVLWLRYHMPSLLMMAKPEEKNIKTTFNMWLFTYSAAGALFALSALEFFVLAPPDSAGKSLLLRGALVSFCVSFFIGRHILYWCREAIIDELAKNNTDVIRSRAASFAPSSILIWFLGVPYIQLHINRMIKKKGLNSYASRRKASPSHKP